MTWFSQFKKFRKSFNMFYQSSGKFFIISQLFHKRLKCSWIFEEETHQIVVSTKLFHLGFYGFWQLFYSFKLFMWFFCWENLWKFKKGFLNLSVCILADFLVSFGLDGENYLNFILLRLDYSVDLFLMNLIKYCYPIEFVWDFSRIWIY